MDIKHIAATAIARARATKDSSAAFDYQVSIQGIMPRGELYNEIYGIANEPLGPVRPGDGDGDLAERKRRADELWEQVLPELETYARKCRSRSYKGWSLASGGPIRYAD